ncbi:MAG: hypothetical protein ABIP17_07830 [Ilumatobacteraceae bacterium]
MADIAQSDRRHERRPITPPIWLVLARGVGFGVVGGALFGLLIVGFVVVALNRDAADVQAFASSAVFFGVLGVLFGSLCGIVGGLFAAVGIILMRIVRTDGATVRLVAALAAAVGVAIAIRLMLHPGLTTNGDVPRREIVERMLFFYVYPCTSAVLAGLFAGPRLLAPVER